MNPLTCMVNCLPKVCDDNLVYSRDFTGKNKVVLFKLFLTIIRINNYVLTVF